MEILGASNHWVVDPHTHIRYEPSLVCIFLIVCPLIIAVIVTIIVVMLVVIMEAFFVASVVVTAPVAAVGWWRCWCCWYVPGWFWSGASLWNVGFGSLPRT